MLKKFLAIVPWYVYAGVIAAIFITGASFGAGATNAHWEHKWDQHIAADKAAIAKAVKAAREDEHRLVKLSDTSGTKQVEVQTRIVGHTITLIKEVPKYVTVQQDAVGCVSFGLVRVLNAAVSGADPSDYQLPPGADDDACTALTPSALAAAIAENYGVARSNAAQLDGLIEDVKQRIDIANGGP